MLLFFTWLAKVALVVWLGEDAKGIQKARSGPQRVDLVNFASSTVTVHAELIVTDKVSVLCPALRLCSTVASCLAAH